MNLSLFESAPAHDPGGRRTFPVPKHWHSEAVFSDCQRYRYELSRIWQSCAYPRLVLWVMMNPSTATESVNDPTVRKCCQFAQDWGYDGVLIGNVVAYRSTNPKDLPKDLDEACGPDNAEHLRSMAQRAELIIFAHGQLPKPLRLASAFARSSFYEMGRKLHVMKLAQDGTPWHPLYLPGNSKPIELEPKP